jgi:hypothetical protein
MDWAFSDQRKQDKKTQHTLFGTIFPVLCVVFDWLGYWQLVWLINKLKH